MRSCIEGLFLYLAVRVGSVNWMIRVVYVQVEKNFEKKL